MRDVVKRYTNGEVTIVWDSGRCIHSGNCFRGLNAVFDPRRRPWITPEGATTKQIIEQVGHCPSGALTTYLNQEGAPENGKE